ncbi:MAG: hypothetical protein ABSH51_04385 [Solirubrobacteraceae bacterium]|jgi:hypothetical protein
MSNVLKKILRAFASPCDEYLYIGMWGPVWWRHDVRAGKDPR